MASIARAPISVSDKTGVIDMAKGLAALARKCCRLAERPKPCVTRAWR